MGGIISLIVGVVILLIGLFAWGIRYRASKALKTTPKEDTFGSTNPEYEAVRSVKGGSTIFGLILPLLSLAFIIPPFFTMVPAKSVGIYVSFGKPVTTVGHGLHTKAPWISVRDMDGTIQNSVYSGDGNRIPVRLGSTASADLDVSVQWRIKTEGAMDVYMNYRPKDGESPLDVVQSNVIDRNLRSSLNAAFGSYDPLSTEAMNDGVGVGAELKSFEQTIKDDLIANSGDQVEIISVTLTNIDFDEDTDKRISDYQAELAKTRNAEQAKKTAEQMAEANRILTESLSDQVNTANCLAIVEKTGQSPLGCFPNAPVTPVTNVQ